MLRKEFLLSVALTFGAGASALAAPTLKATVGHMCCGGCENAAKGAIGSVAGIGAPTVDRASGAITVQAKEATGFDAMALVMGLYQSGFPPTALELSGAETLTMDVGHLCCGGCVGPLQSALKGVAWIKSADVKPNAPVTLTIDASKSVNLSELFGAMGKAGYAAKSLTVSE